MKTIVVRKSFIATLLLAASTSALTLLLTSDLTRVGHEVPRKYLKPAVSGIPESKIGQARANNKPRNRSGIGFMSSRLVGMTAWVSGLRKSSFWPKIPRKTRKKL
jgi:hypothetical protein